MEIKPIGYIYTDFDEKFGIPRQSGRASALFGRIEFEKDYRSDDAFRGIEDFSHLWLIFGFDKAIRNDNSLTVRPPRLGGNKRIGVFASRSPYRPNSLGLSVVKFERLEKDAKKGNVLIVSGVDILNKTPIYDIKPYLPYAESISGAYGSFADEMSAYRLKVDFPKDLLAILPEEKRAAAIECLEDDPRPSYHDDTRKYSMLFAGFDIHFKVEKDVLSVIGVDKKGES